MKTTGMFVHGSTFSRIGVIVAFLLVSAFGAFAKAHYAGEVEMIQSSEVIAIVNVTRVEQTNTAGRVWTYGQRAHATVEKTIKGELPRGNYIVRRGIIHLRPGSFQARTSSVVSAARWEVARRLQLALVCPGHH